ncbi:MAG: GntR family transcriptional regulator [Clostridia bacterium]|nr:GntR family transcriptional regulator [Clostridia bacterium]
MIQIDGRSSKPIYEQIVEGFKEMIIKGILKPGDKIPSVRELSSIIMANPNTVSKAYQELERQKAIETIRGRGTFVAVNYKPRVDDEKLESLKGQIKKIAIEAHYMGMGKQDVVKMLDDIYKELG